MSRETIFPIESQEQLEEVLKNRLGEQAAKITAQFTTDLEEQKTKNQTLLEENAALLKSIEDNKTKYADYDTQFAEMTSKIKDFELKDLKVKVAQESGIPIGLATTLIGEDEEALKAHANILLPYLKNQQNVVPLATGEPAGREGMTPEQEKEQALKSVLNNLKKEN